MLVLTVKAVESVAVGWRTGSTTLNGAMHRNECAPEMARIWMAYNSLTISADAIDVDAGENV